MTDTPKDEPVMLHPVVRRVEEAAIRGYRAMYPDGIPWQELATETRVLWVTWAEKQGEGA